MKYNFTKQILNINLCIFFMFKIHQAGQMD